MEHNTSLSVELTSREGARERTARIFVDFPQPDQLAPHVARMSALLGALAQVDLLSQGKSIDALGGILSPNVTRAQSGLAPARPRFDRLAADGSIAVDGQTHVAVRDNVLGIEWMVDYASPEALEWDDAKAAAEGCRLFGHTDWRLPTRAELLSLVDDTRHDPAIDVALFPGTQPRWHWTGTPWAGSPASAAWGVDFYYGSAGYDDHGDDGFVRAVRSVSPAASGQ